MVTNKKETLQLKFSEKFRKEKCEKMEDWCTGGRGIPYWIWLLMLRSLDIPQTERSRYFSETDIISAEWGFSARTYLYRIFKLKEACTPNEWWEKMAEKVTPEDKKQD